MIAPTAYFDWCDDDAVALHEQPATAVYIARDGAIVIRQERTWDEDGDTLVIIQPEHAKTVAEAILKLAGA